MYSPHPVHEFSTHFVTHCFSTPVPQIVNVFTMTLRISLSKHVGRGNYVGETLKMGETLKRSNMNWFN